MGNVSDNDELYAKITGEELMTGFLQKKYDHLQIILSKNNNRKIGQKYLMVTKSGFGVIKLNHIDFNNNEVHMDLQDESSDIVKHISLNINDEGFKFLLISWDDIVKMVINDNKN
jgi:hypothetical protein